MPHAFPNSLTNNTLADATQVMANFNAAKSWIETLEENRLNVNGAEINVIPEVRSTVSQPNPAGPSSLFSYTENGIAFPTACVLCWVGGFLLYGDAGHTSPANLPGFNVTAEPEGVHAKVTFQNGTGGNVWPKILVIGIGH
jgi:hypothetical protein